MADSDIQISAGTGTKVDTRTVGAGVDEHRQVVCIGDPSVAARVALVDANGGIYVSPTNGAVFEVVTTGTLQVGDGINPIQALDTPARSGFVRITDGTNSVGVDTVHNDNESATENHLMVGSRNSGLNHLGTFDNVRVSVGINKTATYTSAQTGTALWTPAAGKAVVITSVQIQSYGTTAGTAQLWFGGAADTTYTRGTDAAVFDGEFAPSATNKPGVIMTFPTPLRGTADFVLRVTTTNAQSITFNVWGYEI